MVKRAGRLMAVFAAFALAVMAAPAWAVEPPGHSLSLDECIQTALGNHPRVKAAEQDVQAGEYRTRQTIANFWPFANFGISRDHAHIERQVRFGGATIITKASYITNNFSFNTDWTVFDFGRTYYGVRSLAELENKLTSDLTAEQQAVALEAVEGYFNLLLAQKLVGVAEETKATSLKHLEHAQAFFDVGVKPRFDVTNTEVEVNDAELKLIQARDAVKLARVSLNTVLGFPTSAQTEVQDVLPANALTGTMDEYVARAMESRPELRSIEYAERSAEASVKGAYADFLPTLSASATQSWIKEDHSDILSNQDFTVAVNVPIFEGFRTISRVGEAKASQLAVKYRREDAMRGVALEVSKAYLDVEDATARITALVSSVKKARENLDIAQGRYEAGVGPLIEVTDAQLSLTSALTDKATADYDYQIAFARLLRSVGASVKTGEGGI